MLNKKQIRKSNEWVNSNFETKPTTNGWLMLHCPYCDRGREKFKGAIHYGYQRVKCWECDALESIADFIGSNEGLQFAGVLRLLETYKGVDLPVLNYSAVVKNTSVTFPKGYTSILQGTGTLAKRARGYLINRHIDLNFADSIGLGYCIKPGEEYFGRIIIPFFDKGKLVYFIGRDFLVSDPFLRYKNPKTEKIGIGKGEVLFNEEALWFYDSVVLLEGAFDAMSLGKFAIASQGWKLSQKQRNKILESPVKNLCLIPDIGVDNKGVTFLDYAYRTALDFVEFKTVYVVDISPLEHLGKDVNEIGRENIKSLLKGLKPITEQQLLLKLIK
jgi:hypothetical protein